jgi:acyl carrier protein
LGYLSSWGFLDFEVDVEGEGAFSRADILAAITEIVRPILGRPDIVLTESTAARDVPEWDSLAHVTIMVRVEEKFAIRLRAAEIVRLSGVGALIDLVERRTAGI